MKKNLIVVLALLAVVVIGVGNASAQFQIKVPKINKPNLEQTKPEQPKPADNPAPSNQPAAKQTRKVPLPAAPSNPVFLIDTLEISLKTENKYWKFPNQRYYSNWHPKVRFNIFYDNSERSRYTAEWFKPDGSLWFSESLEARTTTDSFESDDGAILSSPYNSTIFDNGSTDQVGRYGLKITNNKTNQVVFQGKFNVKKSVDTPGDPVMKNAFQFFVDNDWHLAVGYAGISQERWSKLELEPEVLLWFKGAPERKDLEARLFYNNQEITSTDDGGLIVDDMKRGDDCVRGQEICRYVQYSFRWAKFKTEQESYMRGKYPGAVFTQDKPGEYTIKVFHKGVQVREAKFNIAPGGLVARNSFSNNLYPLLSMIPVKVMGTAEKWNPASWKTEMFYGNPVSGFSVP